MNDRLLIGTSQESAVMKAGKLRFRKGKEKQVGNAGWKDNSLAWGILLLPIYRVRKKGACVAMCCVGWRGAFRPVYGKRTEQSAIRLLRMAVRWQWRKRAESSADKGLSF